MDPEWVDPECHHECFYKREAEGDFTDRRGGSNVITEAETRMMQPQVKECRQPPEAGKGMKQILSYKGMWTH